MGLNNSKVERNRAGSDWEQLKKIKKIIIKINTIWNKKRDE
jgi:hypothetical protein